MANFDTAEYLALDPWIALIKMINDEYYLQLEPYQTKLVSFTPQGSQAVTVVLDPNRSTTNENLLPALGNQTFTYTRLLLSKYFNQAGGYTLSGLSLPFKTIDLVTRLAGPAVVFDVDDFYEETFTEYPTGSIVIQAKPESLRWEGSLSVKVTNNLKVSLALINNVEVPDAFDYPNGDGTRPQGYFYLNPFDFSEYREVLKPLGKYPNTIEGVELAALISLITGEEWVCSPTPSPRNIATSVVDGIGKYSIRYHGAAMERYTARTDLPTVIVLDLDPTLCTDVLGAVRLHYT